MSRRSIDPRRRLAGHRAHGATLIEALIAILLLGIGLLAMARLSSAAIAHQKSAQVRLTARALAQQYVDLARLNLYGFDLGAYGIGVDDSPPEAIALNVDEADAKAAAERVASEARREWLRAVGDALPGGRAMVLARPGAASREVDVWVLWAEPGASDAGLQTAAQDACPAQLDADTLAGMACLHWRSGL